MIRSLLTAFLSDCVATLRNKKEGSRESLKQLKDIVSWIKRNPGTPPPQNVHMENFFAVLSGALVSNPHKGNFSKAWEKLSYVNKEGLVHEVERFLKNFSSRSFVTIQTPVFLEEKFRREIAEDIMEENRNIVIRFEVEKSLLGGMRIFKDGILKDYSWKNKVKSISRNILQSTV